MQLRLFLLTQYSEKLAVAADGCHCFLTNRH